MRRAIRVPWARYVPLRRRERNTTHNDDAYYYDDATRKLVWSPTMTRGALPCMHRRTTKLILFSLTCVCEASLLLWCIDSGVHVAHVAPLSCSVALIVCSASVVVRTWHGIQLLFKYWRHSNAWNRRSSVVIMGLLFAQTCAMLGATFSSTSCLSNYDVLENLLFHWKHFTSSSETESRCSPDYEARSHSVAIVTFLLWIIFSVPAHIALSYIYFNATLIPSSMYTQRLATFERHERSTAGAARPAVVLRGAAGGKHLVDAQVYDDDSDDDSDSQRASQNRGASPPSDDESSHLLHADEQQCGAPMITIRDMSTTRRRKATTPPHHRRRELGSPQEVSLAVLDGNRRMSILNDSTDAITPRSTSITGMTGTTSNLFINAQGRLVDGTGQLAADVSSMSGGGGEGASPPGHSLLRGTSTPDEEGESTAHTAADSATTATQLPAPPKFYTVGEYAGANVKIPTAAGTAADTTSSNSILGGMRSMMRSAATRLSGGMSPRAASAAAKPPGTSVATLVAQEGGGGSGPRRRSMSVSAGAAAGSRHRSTSVSGRRAHSPHALPPPKMPPPPPLFPHTSPPGRGGSALALPPMADIGPPPQLMFPPIEDDTHIGGGRVGKRNRNKQAHQQKHRATAGGDDLDLSISTWSDSEKGGSAAPPLNPPSQF